VADVTSAFDERFVDIFNAQFQRLSRLLDRLSGEPELASDLAQEAFIRLYRRGSLPDAPEAWLISVAMNLLRNERSGRSRHHRLLTVERGARAHSDPAPSPEQEAVDADSSRRVRAALDRLPEREARLLLLRSEGYSYREIATALELNEASVGTLLARARQAFQALYKDAADAS
jgi:RNA polymerase sigma factor (sigma-70 family)